MASSEAADENRNTAEARGSADLLRQIITHLKGHPPLLYGIGCGLLLIGVLGVAAGQALPPILMVVVLLAGLAAWAFDSRSARAQAPAPQPPSPAVFAPEVTFGEGVDIGDRPDIAAGHVPETGFFTPKVTFGPRATMGDDARVASSDPRTSPPSGSPGDPESAEPPASG